MPPTANLARQAYRHVDYVQFMNLQEINDFMTYWSRDFSRQRIGYLYGYYAKDSNYPVNVFI
jgi:nuclear protein localization family protein 4